MRLFQIIFYIIAFTIGGCFAFQQNVQFPHRAPKNIKLVQQAAPANDSFSEVSAIYPVNEKFNNGKKTFKKLCAACHNRNMKDDLVAPALGGVTARWSAYPKADLYRWIKNSPAMVEEEHPYAKQLWEEWNKVSMPPFPDLADEEIADMLYFIEETSR